MGDLYRIVSIHTYIVGKALESKHIIETYVPIKNKVRSTVKPFTFTLRVFLKELYISNKTEALQLRIKVGVAWRV